MLTAIYPQLKNSRALKFVTEFFYSPYYMIFAAAAMVVSNVFGMELPVYYLFMILAATTVLFLPDMSPTIPLVCCGYMTFSSENNPAAHVETSLFRRPEGLIQLSVIVGVIVVLFGARLIYELKSGRVRRGTPKLLFGFLALGAAYMLGGAFTEYYGFKTLLFGFVQILSLSFFYFYFYFTVDGDRIGGDYMAQLMTVVGCGVVAEILAIYFELGIWTMDGVNRNVLYTGWGMYNNIGCVVAMCLPAPFCLAVTRRNGWAYNLVGNVLFLGLLLAQSRNAILFGTLLYCVCVPIVLYQTKGRERICNFVVYCATAVGLAIGLILFRETIADIFSSLIHSGSDDSGRYNIYINGLKQFSENPVFGNGFYECDAFRYGNLPEDSFLPPRYHDTYVQLLASCGIVSLAAYAYHRAQTILLILDGPSVEKFFLGLSAAALILTSILDCHFFNFGPGLLYSCLLFAAERGSGRSRRRENCVDRANDLAEEISANPAE
ncbi:MAG: O-antigen ligase family protein [Candidatus Gallimonas sp.]